MNGVIGSKQKMVEVGLKDISFRQEKTRSIMTGF